MSDQEGSAIDRATIDELVDAVGGDRSFVTELVEAFRTDAPAHEPAELRQLDSPYTVVASLTPLGDRAGLVHGRGEREVLRGAPRGDGGA